MGLNPFREAASHQLAAEPFPRRACDSQEEGRAGARQRLRDSDIPSFRRGQGLLVTSVPLRTFGIRGYVLAVSGSTGPQAPPRPSRAARGGQAGSQADPEAAAPSPAPRQGASAPPFPHVTSLQPLLCAGRSPGTSTQAFPGYLSLWDRCRLLQAAFPDFGPSLHPWTQYPSH